MLSKGRDAYRYINDETLRLANHGHVPEEIGEMVALPESLATHWALREYYGTINHNVKATYAKYLGAYDGNPSHLHVLPPVEVGAKYVEFMGGADEVIRKARESFEAGEYRWVAEVMNHVVFADPENQEARELDRRRPRADGLPDRIVDLAERVPERRPGAASRNGVATVRRNRQSGLDPGADPADDPQLPRDPPERPEGGRPRGHPEPRRHRHQRRSRAPSGQRRLSHSYERRTADADGTVTTTREILNRLVAAELTVEDALGSGEIKVDPDPAPLIEIFSLLDTFSIWFPVIEP